MVRPERGLLIDAWMQHPTSRLRSAPIFESRRRWVPGTALVAAADVPLAATIEAMDTSAYKFRRYPRERVEYPRGHGRRKVLFGSNRPVWPAAGVFKLDDA